MTFENILNLVVSTLIGNSVSKIKIFPSSRTNLISRLISTNPS